MPKKQSNNKTVRKTVITKTQRTRKSNKKGKRKGGKKTGLGKCTYEYARALANPFEYSSCIPDGSTGTGVFSVKQCWTLGTGAGGSCCGIMTNLDPGALAMVDTLSTQATPAVPGSNWVQATGVTSISNFFARYRPVSMGIRAIFTGNTNNDQGVIVAGQVSGGIAPSAFASMSSANAASLMQNYQIYPLRSGCQVTWRPEDTMDTAEFLDLSTSNKALSARVTLPYLALYVYGATTSVASVLTVEVCWNFEGQYSNTTWMPGGLSNKAIAPAEMGWYERARDFISSVDQVIPLMAGSNLGRAAGNAAIGYLGSLANGMASPRGFNSNLPRLTY